MTTKNRRTLYSLLAPIAVISALAAMAAPVAAQARLAAKHPKGTPSYVVLDRNGSTLGTYKSPCTKSGCPNAIRFLWSAGTCVKTVTTVLDRYPPVAVVLTVNHRVPANTGPMIASCSTALNLTWGKTNILTAAGFQNGSGPTNNVSYLTKHVNGTDLFFQGSDSLLTAEWMRYGKVVGSIKPTGPANDVYWYGSRPPAGKEFAIAKSTRRGSAAAPKVILFGRHMKSTRTTKSSAPAGDNGVAFSWYLNLFQSGAERGCVNSVGGASWTSPAMAYLYTTGGVLNSRVNVLQCPSVHGAAVPMNGVTFNWNSSPSGTTYNLSSATPTFDGVPIPGVALSQIPQPPAGTDGMQFGFHVDDYKSGSWTKSGVIAKSSIPSPGHVKVGTWIG